MAYSPENNPYVPGDPYMYDLKWLVRNVKENSESISSIEQEIRDIIETGDESVYARVRKFETTLQMLASPLLNKDICITSGYSSANDGNGAVFYISGPAGSKAYSLTPSSNTGLRATILGKIIDTAQLGLSGTIDGDILTELTANVKVLVISGNITADFTVASGCEVTGTGTITGIISSLSNCSINNININGKIVCDECERVKIYNCNISATDYGVYGTKSHYLDIRYCSIVGATVAGVYLEGDLNIPRGLARNTNFDHICANHFNLCDRAIEVNSLAESEIAENHINQSTVYGINIIDSNRVDVYGNWVLGTRSIEQLVGIRLYGPDYSIDIISPYNTYIYVHHNSIQYCTSSGILLEGYGLNNKVESNSLMNVCEVQGIHNSPILCEGSTYGTPPYKHLQGCEVRNNRIIYTQGDNTKPTWISWDIHTINTIEDVIEGNISDCRPFRVSVEDLNSSYVDNDTQNYRSFDDGLTAINATIDTVNIARVWRNGNTWIYKITLSFSDVQDDNIGLVLPFPVGQLYTNGIWHSSGHTVWGGIYAGSDEYTVRCVAFDGSTMITGSQYSFYFTTQAQCMANSNLYD